MWTRWCVFSNRSFSLHPPSSCPSRSGLTHPQLQRVPVVGAGCEVRMDPGSPAERAAVGQAGLLQPHAVAVAACGAGAGAAQFTSCSRGKMSASPAVPARPGVLLPFPESWPHPRAACGWVSDCASVLCTGLRSLFPLRLPQPSSCQRARAPVTRVRSAPNTGSGVPLPHSGQSWLPLLRKGPSPPGHCCCLFSAL